MMLSVCTVLSGGADVGAGGEADLPGTGGPERGRRQHSCSHLLTR